MILYLSLTKLYEKFRNFHPLVMTFINDYQQFRSMKLDKGTTDETSFASNVGMLMTI